MGSRTCRQCGTQLRPLAKPHDMNPDLCIRCFSKNTAAFYKLRRADDTLETVREKALASGLTGGTVEHLIDLARKRQERQTT